MGGRVRAPQDREEQARLHVCVGVCVRASPYSMFPFKLKCQSVLLIFVFLQLKGRVGGKLDQLLFFISTHQNVWVVLLSSPHFRVVLFLSPPLGWCSYLPSLGWCCALKISLVDRAALSLFFRVVLPFSSSFGRSAASNVLLDLYQLFDGNCW